VIARFKNWLFENFARNQNENDATTNLVYL
jgi:hypothetical protein